MSYKDIYQYHIPLFPSYVPEEATGHPVSLLQSLLIFPQSGLMQTGITLNGSCCIRFTCQNRSETGPYPCRMNLYLSDYAYVKVTDEGFVWLDFLSVDFHPITPKAIAKATRGHSRNTGAHGLNFSLFRSNFVFIFITSLYIHPHSNYQELTTSTLRHSKGLTYVLQCNICVCMSVSVFVFVDVQTFCAARCRAARWLWSVLLTVAPAFSRISAQSSRSASTQYIKGVRPNWSSRSRSNGSATHTAQFKTEGERIEIHVI